ncbi:MAG: inositol monophosphatase family protein [Candidatus Micrarchaeota archaeon]
MSVYLSFLKKLAFKAGKLQLTNYRKNISFTNKSSIDLVSEVDMDIEAFCVEAVKKKFPNHGFIGEEDNCFNEDAEFVWLFDPLDGTNNYARGLPWFSFVGCLLKNKQPVVSVVFDPIRKELFHAEKGKGAFLNGKRIFTSKLSFKESLVSFSDYTRHEKTLCAYQRMVGKTLGVRVLGSSALEIAFVACGRYGGKVKFGFNVWDFLPASLLVTEAGGIVTDFTGRKICFDSKGEVFSGNKQVHSELLRLVKKCTM